MSGLKKKYIDRCLLVFFFFTRKKKFFAGKGTSLVPDEARVQSVTVTSGGRAAAGPRFLFLWCWFFFSMSLPQLLSPLLVVFLSFPLLLFSFLNHLSDAQAKEGNGKRKERGEDRVALARGPACRARGCVTKKKNILEIFCTIYYFGVFSYSFSYKKSFLSLVRFR